MIQGATLEEILAERDRRRRRSERLWRAAVSLFFVTLLLSVLGFYDVLLEIVGEELSWRPLVPGEAPVPPR